jgi:hypothetical protein
MVTLCDNVREICPEFPGGPQALHWSIPDPAAAGEGRASYTAFCEVTADLHTPIGYSEQRDEWRRGVTDSMRWVV